MKKPLIFGLAVVIGLVGLIKLGAINYLVLFLLIGVIPGTSYTVPSGIMLLIMISMMWAIIFRFMAIETFYSIATKRQVERRLERKKRMPRRRYNQI